MFFFVFFKQKTAYEMRISDWSSDVCSSDLRLSLARCAASGGLSRRRRPIRRRTRLLPRHPGFLPGPVTVDLDPERDAQEGPHQHKPGQHDEIVERRVDHQRLDDVAGDRSEEHTSELQSLIRISYAVFCLTKKKN